MSLTYLQQGWRVLFEGRVCVVETVNDCTARLRPAAGQEKRYTPQTGRDAGKTIIIKTKARAFYVSPNAPLERVP